MPQYYLPILNAKILPDKHFTGRWYKPFGKNISS
jgi:hypothetical protein